MGSLTSPTTKFAYKFYEVLQDLNPPVINVINDLLVGVGGVEVIFMSVQQNNDEVANKEIDVIITKDGEVTLYDASAEGGQNNAGFYSYVLGIMSSPTVSGYITMLNLGVADPNFMLWIVDGASKPLKGKDITIQTRMTSAAGTNQRLYSKIWYLLKEAV